MKLLNIGTNPIGIGGYVVRRGDKPTEVPDDVFKEFKEAESGASLAAQFIREYDPQGKSVSIEANIRAELEDEYLRKLADIRRDMQANFDSRLEDEKQKIRAVFLEGPSEEENSESTPDDSDEFVFNPEIHSLDHRGAGTYSVMDGENAVYGPLGKDSEELKLFQEMMKEDNGE